MRIKPLSFILFLAVPTAVSAQIEWSGTTKPVIEVKAPAESGLDKLYVVPAMQGAGVAFTPPSGNPAQVRWYAYGNMGGGYAQDVASAVSGSRSVLVSPQADTGYIVEDGTKRYYFWVIDLSRHPLAVSSLTLSPEQDCGRVSLDVAGTGDELVYFGVNGRRLTLSREIMLDYNTLEWNVDSENYATIAKAETLAYLPPVIHASAPLCATDFTIAGDRFMREWGTAVSYTSPLFQPHSVECHTSAVQTQREADNEIGASAGSELGGSAPCEVTFSASVTDAAIFREWQFSRKADFEDIDLRMSDLDFTYTFTEQGTMYVRFYCANADASCEAYGETYEISIGTSSLKCPNAFSPFNEDGVNDIWKVSYSSIVSFSCSIFNRYGREMVSFDDPAQGWDGKYHGKFVPAGVYYYVIKARGADGRDYNLSGDINIVDYK